MHFATTSTDIRPGDVVTTEVTYAAPHHLVADGEPVDVRRTRSGDAWEARTESPRSVGVTLGMPTVGAPAEERTDQDCGVVPLPEPWPVGPVCPPFGRPVESRPHGEVLASILASCRSPIRLFLGRPDLVDVGLRIVVECDSFEWPTTT